MIYGNVNNASFEQQAAVLPGPLKNALHALKGMDLANHETGAFPMALDGVDMILQVMDLETSPREAHDPEIHRKYIDLQLLVSGGPEVHTFFPDGGKETVKDDRLDTPKDILFYENRPETARIEGRVVLEPGDYAVYFPWDIHVPGQCDADGPTAYRKIVLKVPVAACL